MKRNAEELYPCAGSTRTIAERHAKPLVIIILLQRVAALVLYGLKRCPFGRAQAAVTYTCSAGICGRVAGNGKQFCAGSQPYMRVPAVLKGAVSFADCALSAAHLTKS